MHCTSCISAAYYPNVLECYLCRPGGLDRGALTSSYDDDGAVAALTSQRSSLDKLNMSSSERSARAGRARKRSSASSSKSSSSKMNGQDKGKGRQQETLLLVFIHGFKGSETTTFADFPQLLADNVQSSCPHMRVQPIIYPTYETRGSLSKAVEAFVDWLTTKCVEMECAELMAAAEVDDASQAPRSVGGAGSVKIVLCGHSMGGLVAVDAALEVASSSCGKDKKVGKLWPRICGVIAFDTPYCGVHPRVFKNTANKYHGLYQQARSTAEQLAPVGAALASWWGKGANGAQQQQQQQRASSNWTKTLVATGVLALAGGAAAGTYYGGGWTYISDHFLFVSNLADNAAQRQRLDKLIDLPQIFFHALYNRLPPLARDQPPRVFIIMPLAESGSGRTSESFEAIDNATASDEIDAHTTMFYASNSSYKQLADRAAALIVRCLDNEERFGDQVHAQEAGDLEHGASDDEAYPEAKVVDLT